MYIVQTLCELYFLYITFLLQLNKKIHYLKISLNNINTLIVSCCFIIIIAIVTEVTS